MRNPGLVLVGILIIVAGVASLLGAVFHFDSGVICWPAGLILLGIYLLLRPNLVRPGTGFRASIFGPVRRSGAWKAADEEIWLAMGDVTLDLTQAEIPSGETLIRVFAFIGDVRVRVPDSVGISVTAMSGISTVRGFGAKRESFVVPLQMVSEGYGAAERRLRLEVTAFIAEVKVTVA
jgi:predicted membrane protein